MKGFKQHPKMSHGGHYCWGGKVMKKREGGDVKVEKAEKMPSGAQQYVSGKDRYEKHKTIEKYAEPAIDEMYKSVGKDNFKEKLSKSKKFVNAAEENANKYKEEVDQRISAEDFGEEGQAGMKRGGMAKGGNWIQGAIKKPGALKKSLGVPADKPIPAAKLEKASKAPGKMGQRARLAMTLKGMK